MEPTRGSRRDRRCVRGSGSEAGRWTDTPDRSTEPVAHSCLMGDGACLDIHLDVALRPRCCGSRDSTHRVVPC